MDDIECPECGYEGPPAQDDCTQCPECDWCVDEDQE